jgi:hypothetical protein
MGRETTPDTGYSNLRAAASDHLRHTTRKILERPAAFCPGLKLVYAEIGSAVHLRALRRRDQPARGVRCPSTK